LRITTHAPVFTEGFDTADLKDAKALLDELSAQSAIEKNRDDRYRTAAKSGRVHICKRDEIAEVDGNRLHPTNGVVAARIPMQSVTYDRHFSLSSANSSQGRERADLIPDIPLLGELAAQV
jgi:hypothetical protein